jgi:hypothetical protein
MGFLGACWGFLVASWSVPAAFRWVLGATQGLFELLGVCYPRCGVSILGPDWATLSYIGYFERNRLEPGRHVLRERYRLFSDSFTLPLESNRGPRCGVTEVFAGG